MSTTPDTYSAQAATQGAWRDDFSWARTQSFAMVAREHKWVVWLDSDDILVGGKYLGTAAALAEQNNVPYAMVMYDYHWTAGGGRTHKEPTPRARLVHRDRGEWSGQVHEDFREDIKYRGRPALAVPYEIMHVKHQHQLRPAGRYLALVEQAANDPQRTPRGLFLLARELCTVDRFEEALPPLLRYLNERHDAIEGDPNDFRLAAYLLGADIAERIGDYPTQGWLQHEANAYAKRMEEHKACAPRAASSKVGRNDPCACGSGKKSKKCCGVDSRRAA